MPPNPMTPRTLGEAKWQRASGGGWGSGKYTVPHISPSRCHFSSWRWDPVCLPKSSKMFRVSISPLSSRGASLFRDVSPGAAWEPVSLPLLPHSAVWEDYQNVSSFTQKLTLGHRREAQAWLCTAGGPSNPPIHKHLRGWRKMGREHSFPRGHFCPSWDLKVTANVAHVGPPGRTRTGVDLPLHVNR